MSASNPFEAWLTAWAAGINATSRMFGQMLGNGPAVSSTFSLPFGAPAGSWPFQPNPWASWMPHLGQPQTGLWPMAGGASGMFPWMTGGATFPFNMLGAFNMQGPFGMQANPWHSLMAPMAQRPPLWSATLPWGMPGMANPAPNPSWDPFGLMKALPAMMGSFGAQRAPANDPAAAWQTAMASVTSAWAPFLGTAPPAPPVRKPAEPFKLDDPFGLSTMTKMWMAWMPSQTPSDSTEASRRRDPEPEPAPASAVWPWAPWWKPPG